MSNYKLITGPFAGEVIENKQILDLGFLQLDEDLQILIREFGEEFFCDGEDFSVSLNELVVLYEDSWRRQETEEAITLFPLSENQETN